MKVLCAGNASTMKYYFNEEEFGILPSPVKDDLKILVVRYLSDVGGILTLQFDDKGDLQITTMEPIDEIGAELKITRLREESKELFTQLEAFYQSFKK